jgi:hypothetical protein
VNVISFTLEPSMATLGSAEPMQVIRLSVVMDIAWDMLPYPSARRTVITRNAFQDASVRLGRADETRQVRELLVSDLRIHGQVVPDLIVVPSLAPSRLRVDGFLGLDFFSQFDLVEWHPKNWQMRLTFE